MRADGIAAAHEAEARLLALPRRLGLATAHDPNPSTMREIVIVRVTDGETVGWGECSALGRPGYTAEFARGCFEALTTAGRPGPMARAAIEMAAWDLRLKRAGESLAHALGGPVVDRVDSGVALGLASEAVIEAEAGALAAAGFRRIKVKITGDRNLDAVAAAQRGAPGVELQVDANGSLHREHVAMLVELVSRGVTAIEQPFAPDDIASAVELVGEVDVPVVGDEAVESAEDAARLWEAGALTGVSVKAPRLGGLSAALEMVHWCREHSVVATAGGMLESGLGRHALVALASIPGFTLAGDVSPAQRWLAADPFSDVAMIDGTVLVPTAPGVAPAPDQELLDRYTVDRRAVSAMYFEY